MDVKLLKVIERYQILMLALRGQISQKEAAKKLGLSHSHAKRLVGELREAGGDIDCLCYNRHHPAPNRFPHEVRNGIITLKMEPSIPSPRSTIWWPLKFSYIFSLKRR